MSTAYSGKDGKVKANAVDMNVSKWSASVTVAEVDCSTTGDAGWTDTRGWVKSVEGSFEFNFDTGKSPFAAAQLLTPGEICPLELFVDPTKKLAGNALITKVDPTSEYKGKITATANFKNSGAWTLPT